jgi:NAD(P)-dependent dehydrogenase (short-subunit alcohol dehydrogenase family)
MPKINSQTVRPRGFVQYNNHDRVVLVTGGVQGIGRSICEGFAATGAKVVCADLKAELAKDLPKGIAFQQTDVSIEEQCQSVVQWTVNQFGGLDILVNNAAIQPPGSYVPVHQLPSSELEKMTRVNFFGYCWMAKYSLAQMKLQQSGVVINIGSGQGHRTARQVPVYGPIKAANLLQTLQWGVEYARDGIRVVSVSPGAIDTPLVRASLEAQGGEAALANRHPIGRIGRPEEIAKAVMWLASDDASFVTATDLEVDGGLGAFGAFADPYQ